MLHAHGLSMLHAHGLSMLHAHGLSMLQGHGAESSWSTRSRSTKIRQSEDQQAEIKIAAPKMGGADSEMIASPCEKCPP